MTQSFFVRYPHSISLFEPCRRKVNPSIATGDKAMLRVSNQKPLAGFLIPSSLEISLYIAGNRGIYVMWPSTPTELFLWCKVLSMESKNAQSERTRWELHDSCRPVLHRYSIMWVLFRCTSLAMAVQGVFMITTVKPKVNCLPLWREVCLQSEFINIKTIRVLTPEDIQWFIQRNPDVHVIHLVSSKLSWNYWFGLKYTHNWIHLWN